MRTAPPPKRRGRPYDPGIGLELLIDRWLKTRSGQIVGSLVSCLLMTVATMFLVPIGYGQWRLSRDPTFVPAAVTDTQTFHDSQRGDAPTGYAVRYRFAVAGRTYGFRGPAGNEWAYVPKAVMDAAAASRRIKVAYLAGDPQNNLPAVRLTWLWLWGVGLIGGTLAVTAATWVWVRRVARHEADRRTGPPAGD